MTIELADGRCQSDEVLEALRLRAVHARELGYAVVAIATILGVREETVSRWCSRYDQGGQEALPGDRTGGRSASGRLLTGEQEQGIQQAIETKTPQELEIPWALWTRGGKTCQEPLCFFLGHPWGRSVISMPRNVS